MVKLSKISLEHLLIMLKCLFPLSLCAYTVDEFVIKLKFVFYYISARNNSFPYLRISLKTCSHKALGCFGFNRVQSKI